MRVLEVENYNVKLLHSTLVGIGLHKCLCVWSAIGNMTLSALGVNRLRPRPDLSCCVSGLGDFFSGKHTQQVPEVVEKHTCPQTDSQWGFSLDSVGGRS